MAYTVGTPTSDSATGSATNIATPGTITVAAGDTIVAFTTVAQDQTTTMAISDGTNTYDRVFTQYDGSALTYSIFVAEDVAAGTYTLTATWDGGTRANRSIFAFGISGLKAASFQTGTALRNSQATPGTGADGVTSGNTTPTEQPACLLGWHFAGAAAGTPATGTGFTSVGTGIQFGTGVDQVRVQHKRLTSTAAVASTATAAANSTHISLAVILSEESGGGGGGDVLAWFSF
jgi:hypothetical protein